MSALAFTRPQRGIGIAEILVALTLGLLVTLAASAMLLVANRDFVNHGANARLTDGGRYALELVEQGLRQSAWTDLETGTGTAADAAPAITGLDNRSLTRTAAGLGGAVAGINGSDVLALRFSGAGNVAGYASVIDCAGFAAGTAQDGWSIFYVGMADDGESELRCKYVAQSGNWNADAIVRGVDSFQVLYGVDTDEPRDGIPNRYLNASGIAALDGALALAGATPAEQAADLRRRTWWKRVATVRVALLLHGETGSRPASLPARYELFGAAYGDALDAGTQIDEARLPEALRWRARRVFETAVLLRNRDG
ncbi:type IV pilus assembly protein PilW [Pseudoduganella lurida]|uniref:Type IV pilus assembly protein PilW n=1 Tax=Pseudoduganella lurida TaxID=1036180 RepID=A0A562RMD0_9BURK|nr:PilW family protein [Pseudoduganella lurida]TWI70208.1 type IV pilus assembly protein PilW [Pseudoduganella lurida]